MKRFSLGLTVTVAASFALFASGCAETPGDSLLGGGGSTAVDPDSLAAGDGNTHQHFKESIGGDNGLVDEKAKHVEDQQVGSPEVVARLHGTQKIGYGALGGLLADMGVNLQGNGAGAIYRGGGSALGMPIYANRVPEQIVPSTSSLAKEFDIFVAAASEIQANIATSKRCPGVVLAQNSVFTDDGITCLLGKPARPEHTALANDLVTKATTPQLGEQIAIAALLAAAHTSE